MKKTILFAFILSACSSAPKSPESSPPPSNSSQSYGDSIDVGEDAGPAPVQVSKAPPLDASINQDQLRAAVESNNSRKVEDIASQLLARNPKDVRALNALGVQQIKANKPALARLIFKKALDVEPKNAAVLNNYGLTFLAEKEEFRAMQEFKKALDADSKNVAAAGNLGALHLKAKNYDEARRWLEIAYDKNKSNVKLANDFGISLRGTGDYSAARRVYEQAGGIDSKDTALLLNYAILLVENLNDKTKGQEVVNKIKFLASDTAILERAKQLEAKIK